MKIALLGYGKMGKTIERVARDRGHEVVLIVDENNRAACTDDQLKQADFVYIGRGADKTGTGDGMLSCLFNNERKCVVIADIYRSPWHRRIWRQYCEKATVSIDMMWYGIVLFDDKIQKGKYNLII